LFPPLGKTIVLSNHRFKVVVDLSSGRKSRCFVHFTEISGKIAPEISRVEKAKVCLFVYRHCVCNYDDMMVLLKSKEIVTKPLLDDLGKTPVPSI
jgi:hypothetical protein